MRRIESALLAIAVSAVCIHTAVAAVRPRYGGTLRVALSDSPSTIDPKDAWQANSVPLQSMARLIFDTLVNLDAQGLPQPWLASSWQVEPGNQRWQFTIRRGVTFSDGSVLTADIVAASLRSANPKWKIFPSVDTVTVEIEAPNPFLPAELAQLRYAIAKRDKQLKGTGPFIIKGWTPGKQLTLTARDDYWNGRAFLDTVEVELGKPVRDQLIAFDVGNLDLLEVSPETAFSANDHRVEHSLPEQFVGLVFARSPSSPETGLREALALSIDRATINNVLLRGSGELSASVLPDWISGYSFLFPVGRDLDRARQLSNEAKPAVAAWTLRFDPTDPVLRLIAERIVLNAKDAGLSLQLSNGPSADITLMRMTLSSNEPQTELTDLLTRLGMPAPNFENPSASTLYAAEKAALDSQRLIPLFHLRSTVALSNNLRGWEQTGTGIWRLENAWLWTVTP